jgi:Na+-driven multidrug efflux pump
VSLSTLWLRLILLCRAIQVAAVQGIVVVAAMQPLNAVVFIGDGVFQGATDFLYLALSMALACGLSAGIMLVGGGGLQDVWIALFALQLLRTVAVAARYADAVPVLGGSPLARRAL